MSHSYKKNPIVKDNGKGKKDSKRIANHKVRRNKYIPLTGGNYKKMYESWDIADYVCRYTLEEAIADWYEEEEEHHFENSFGKIQWRHDKYHTLENWIRHWKKMMINK